MSTAISSAKRFRPRASKLNWLPFAKFLLPACLLLLIPSLGSAQDFPRWELFGGGSYYLVGRQPGLTVYTEGHGPQAGLSHSFNNYFRLTGEFNADFADRVVDLVTLPPGSRHHNSKLLLGLVGPEFVFRRPDRKFNVFAHYLTGIAYARDNQFQVEGKTVNSPTGISTIPAVTAFSWVNAIGSGMDLKIPHRVSIRLLEVDWMRTNFPNNPHSNWRFASGFVLRLGETK